VRGRFALAPNTTAQVFCRESYQQRRAVRSYTREAISSRSWLRAATASPSGRNSGPGLSCSTRIREDGNFYKYIELSKLKVRGYPFALQEIGHGIRYSKVDISFSSVEPLQGSIDVYQATAAGLCALRGVRRYQRRGAYGLRGP
jgi:hypothetical protein